MASSGSYDFNLTAAQLCARVAKNIGALSSGGTINSNDEADILQTLNIVAKELQGTADGSQGIKLQSRQRVTLMLAKGQQTYLIGPGSSDARASTAIGRTTLSAAEASGQTVLSITSNTDATSYPGSTITMTASDIIGIQLDDGTIYWSTISGTPTTTATVAVAITGNAAAGNYVWWFTSRAQRFPVLEAAVLRDSSFNDSELEVYTEVRQYELGNASKLADGTPTALLCEPVRTQTRITLNSQPTDVTDTIVLTVLYPSEDYDETTNDIAYPQEWIGYLEWETTLRCCPMFGKTWTQEFQLNYANAASRARALNPENSVAYFQPGGD